MNGFIAAVQFHGDIFNNLFALFYTLKLQAAPNLRVCLTAFDNNMTETHILL
jgi:hypothetical protein